MKGIECLSLSSFTLSATIRVYHSLSTPHGPAARKKVLWLEFMVFCANDSGFNTNYLEFLLKTFIYTYCAIVSSVVNLSLSL